jgi:transcriptional regulator with GAF, ATPase, and Fis domain
MAVLVCRVAMSVQRGNRDRAHEHSPRANGPFVIVDCGAMHEQWLESELFGHARGAFTGTTSDRDGAFLDART